MKPIVSIILILIVANTIGYCQDTIIRKNGVRVLCNILKEDSNSVYFTIKENDKYIDTYLHKTEIESYKYKKTASNVPSLRAIDKVTVGTGYGFDYGGLGLNVLYYPQKNIGIFAGLGYAFIGAGYNAGIKLRLISEIRTSKLVPYAIGMYGFNAAVAVKNANQFNKFFYGPTVGLGFDNYVGLKNRGYFSFALLVPFRGPSVYKYIDTLKKNLGIISNKEFSPIAITIGYHFFVE